MVDRKEGLVPVTDIRDVRPEERLIYLEVEGGNGKGPYVVYKARVAPRHMDHYYEEARWFAIEEELAGVLKDVSVMICAGYFLLTNPPVGLFRENGHEDESLSPQFWEDLGGGQKSGDGAQPNSLKS